MYHDVTPEPSAVGGGATFFSVSRAGFERQLDTIASMGLRGCSIAEVLSGDAANRVAISFDDGDFGQAARAFPALAARGMTATFFVTTGWIGRAGYASWEQLREMRASGMAVESHTHTHPFLSELSDAAVRDELRRSRDLIGQELGAPASMIALPGGDAPRASLRGLFGEEGYRVVATSRWGINGGVRDSSLLYVRRCTVRGEPDAAAFAAIVRGSGWLRMRKRARERVLALLRSSLGPTRYARWRRGVLDATNSDGTER